MHRLPHLLVLALLFLPALAASPAGAQDAGPPRGTARERMWPAPTAEDWAKPCLIVWQRTWEDALAVSKETEKAILICINMDGEIASEHYAGVRYRSPEIASLYEPYVTVIASVYRHTPRDYDDEGNRVVCPRFGTVTCGEHIAIEPILYEKYFDGERVAPRHIMIELDGSEKYDVYYRNDTASVFEDIRKGIADREIQPKPIVRGDRSVVERVASRDVADRIAVETAYKNGDQAARRSMLEAAGRQGGKAPLELLRLAVFGLDVEMAKVAREVLAKTESEEAVNLISDALRVPMEESQKAGLIAALERLGQSSPKARWLAAVHDGLTGRSEAIDVKGWTRGGGEYRAPPEARKLGDLESKREDRARESAASPEDAGALMDLSEASLAFALKARRPDYTDPRMAYKVARHMFEDARVNAEAAEKLGAPAWRVDTVLAIVAYYAGDTDTAYARAETAAKHTPPGDVGWNAMAVLTIFAEGRFKAIKASAKARKRWPAAWLTDLDAAYAAILAHPHSTDEQVVWHHDFLMWLSAKYRASRFLRACLGRFPDSSVLHQRLRSRLLREKGPDALERTYEAMAGDENPPKNIDWFAGYASLAAAETQRRQQRVDKAFGAYDRSLDHFDRAAQAKPDDRYSADHYAALVLAARARLSYEAGDDDAALSDVLASFARSPRSAGSPDGLGITPVSTAQMLGARLKEAGNTGAAAKIEDALALLDPELLIPPEDK